MNKILKISTLFWFILLAVAARGYASYLPQDLEQALRRSVLSDCSEYVITLPASISTLPAKYDSLRVELLADAPSVGSTWIKVYFYKEETVFQSVNLNIQINLYQHVLVAKQAIRGDEILTPDMFEISRRDVSAMSDPAVISPEELSGMEALRPIPQGKVLTHSMMTKEQVIKRGARVTIEYVTGSLKLTAAGEAIQPGSRGDMIKVKNISSSKIITAEVQDEQSVKVTR